MNDRPTAIELIQAVREWLQGLALPVLKREGALGFQGLIAANVLGIVERELQTEKAQLRTEWQRLARILSLTDVTSPTRDRLRGAILDARRELGERIHQGAYDDPARCRELIQELRKSVTDKLKVNNPRFLMSEPTS